MARSRSSRFPSRVHSIKVNIKINIKIVDREFHMKLTISGKRIVSYLLSVRLITPNSNRRYQEKIPTTNYLTGKLFINYVAPL